MEQELVTFQRFKDEDIANDIAQKLKDAGLFFEMEDDAKIFDPSFAKNPMLNEIRIKLRPADFIKANTILDDYYSSLVNTIDKDYYLFDFTDQELSDILAKPDEWGHLDNQLAKKILKDRGKEIGSTEIENLKTKRISELKRPEKSATWLIIIGYVSAALGGVFGIIIGLILSSTKRTLPNGQQVYSFCENDRDNGRVMAAIGIIVFILAVLYKLFFMTGRL
jgi:hypothetical protein